ncbi:hypothetical protein KX928_21840 [Roseobacter sp. YSTF-M11]|uniref:Phage protein D n=1 Tax=Roseobacter insulae TaxID=2859783 RepID=A0A9X1FZI3_9RHOB|nr:hypothetical protein [Roseobacter insulae]MBW4710441.1 hypothetical protein [Roseobacter insulae]
MLTPTYKVTLGDQRVDMRAEPLASTLLDIDVRRDMAPLIDRFDLTIARVGSLAPKRGNDAEIALGFAGADTAPVTVMTGAVDQIDAGPERVRVTGFGAGRQLSRDRDNLTFRDKTAADIVTELADASGLAVARSQTSEVLPYFVTDARQNRFQHMTALARLTGFDLYCDTDNDLVFEPFGSGQRVFPLDHGEDVLEYQVERTVSRAANVEAWGESPGASAGAESWSWLVKDFEPLRGSAGTGAPLALLEHSALRTAEAAQRAADALLARLLNQRLRGQVTVLGNPDIQLGDAIRLQGMPDADLNATFQVRGLRHRISKATGFVTVVRFQSIGGAP